MSRAVAARTVRKTRMRPPRARRVLTALSAAPDPSGKASSTSQPLRQYIPENGYTRSKGPWWTGLLRPVRESPVRARATANYPIFDGVPGRSTSLRWPGLYL